ncbi:hypothetical protein D3C74_361470 [compost metagenome]
MPGWQRPGCPFAVHELGPGSRLLLPGIVVHQVVEGPQLAFRSEHIAEPFADRVGDQVAVHHRIIQRGVHQIDIAPGLRVGKRSVDQPRIGAAEPKLAHNLGESRCAELVDHASPGPGAGVDHYRNLPVPQSPGFSQLTLLFRNFNLLNFHKVIAATQCSKLAVPPVPGHVRQLIQNLLVKAELADFDM